MEPQEISWFAIEKYLPSFAVNCGVQDGCFTIGDIRQLPLSHRLSSLTPFNLMLCLTFKWWWGVCFPSASEALCITRLISLTPPPIPYPPSSFSIKALALNAHMLLDTVIDGRNVVFITRLQVLVQTERAKLTFTGLSGLCFPPASTKCLFKAFVFLRVSSAESERIEKSRR